MLMAVANMPLVVTDNAALRSELGKVFRDIAHGTARARGLSEVPASGPHAGDMDEHLVALPQSIERLVPVMRRTSMRITYSGARISFAMDETDRHFDHGMGIYRRSNEGYTLETEKALKTAAGITHYLGIAGGLDAGLAQLAVLKGRNSMSGVRIIDRNYGQIIYSTMKLLEYDTMTAEAVLESPDFAALSGIGSPIPEGIHVGLSVNGIMGEMRGISEPGSYFVYASNIFMVPVFTSPESGLAGTTHSIGGLISGSDGAKATEEFLRAFMENRSVQDGSCIMFSKANGDSSMIVRKEGKGVVPLAITGFGEAADLAAQQGFFDSVTSGKEPRP